MPIDSVSSPLTHTWVACICLIHVKARYSSAHWRHRQLWKFKTAIIQCLVLVRPIFLVALDQKCLTSSIHTSWVPNIFIYPCIDHFIPHRQNSPHSSLNGCRRNAHARWTRDEVKPSLLTLSVRRAKVRMFLPARSKQLTNENAGGRAAGLHIKIHPVC